MTPSEEKMFDVRLVRHHIRRETLDQPTLDKQLDTLEDCAELCEETVTRFTEHEQAEE